jgi:hypothetical protein
MSGNSGGRVLGATASVGGATLVSHSNHSLLHQVLIVITVIFGILVILAMILNRTYRKIFR